MIPQPKQRAALLPDLGKPIDEMTDEERLAAVERMLVQAGVPTKRALHGRFRRSKYTDAIVNAGPNWHPGMPLGLL